MDLILPDQRVGGMARASAQANEYQTYLNLTKEWSVYSAKQDHEDTTQE